MSNYKLISEALEFYEKYGFKYVDVPWVVDEEISLITKPSGLKDFPFKDKVLVASGEQSFLQMIKNGKLEPGKYSCVTPCFRDETIFSEYTKQYFTKVELINTEETNDFALWDMIWGCLKFFNINGVIATTVETNEGIDILANNVEIGSYGIRNHEKVGSWIYGTGLAEPRFSAVLGLY